MTSISKNTRATLEFLKYSLLSLLLSQTGILGSHAAQTSSATLTITAMVSNNCSISPFSDPQTTPLCNQPVAFLSSELNPTETSNQNTISHFLIKPSATHKYIYF